MKTILTVILTAMLTHLSLAATMAPPIDMDAIRNDPLAVTVEKSEVEDGIVIEHLTFNGDRDLEGKFIRLEGILAYPEGGKELPGVLWCQGGMGDARTYFPVLFAKKGYLSLHISLAKEQWSAHSKFDATIPANANMVRLGSEQLRAVTLIANRPEVDAEKLGVCGASYGGLFSTFVASVDPRIKAGASFFAGGNHQLGTSLPQFIQLENLAEIQTWVEHFDPATFMRQREIPFIWGVPTNDNWFYFPALMETYRQKPGEKRLAILPHWIHGFTPEIDQQLFDWLDIWLKGSRDPYVLPKPVTLTNKDGKLVAEWSWTGKPTAKRAELIVSYGKALPWHGWRHRYYHTIPATIDGQTARAEILVPDPELPMIIFGNVTDDRDVLISSEPIEAKAIDLGITKATGYPKTEGSPRGKFEVEDTHILKGTAQGFGRPDPTTFHSGAQSVAMDEGKKRRSKYEARLTLFNVPDQAHRVEVWLKAEHEMTVDIAVRAQFPFHWDKPAVKAILATMPEAKAIPEKSAIPTYEKQAKLTTEWQRFIIDVPAPTVAVEGYLLTIDRQEGETGTWWIDDASFTTIWPGQH